jgi:hypothetical protein
VAPSQKGKPRGEFGRIERAIAEEIEVYGLPVAEMECDGGTTIKHELLRHSAQFVPQPALGRRQYGEVGLEGAGHSPGFRKPLIP